MYSTNCDLLQNVFTNENIDFTNQNLKAKVTNRILNNWKHDEL